MYSVFEGLEHSRPGYMTLLHPFSILPSIDIPDKNEDRKPSYDTELDLRGGAEPALVFPVSAIALMATRTCWRWSSGSASVGLGIADLGYL